MTVRVLKIGGSVLTGRAAYHRAADFIGGHLTCSPGDRIVVVVSAESGVTDALLDEARAFTEDPAPATLDLLWSTGEVRSAALLSLCLQARGIDARAVNVHECGLYADARERHPRASALKLRAVLAGHDVLVVPGFLARSAGDAIVSLGRGGSDLTAVLLASSLSAPECRLVKDVPGYFTSDPKRDPAARPIGSLTYSQAIERADTGCELVQRRALEAAEQLRVPLVVSAIGFEQHTLIHS